MRLPLALTLIALALRGAYAAPPEGADPAMAPWSHSLTQPDTNYPCCSISDCRPVKARILAGHHEAFIDKHSFGASAPDRWTWVPDENVLHGRMNPTGEPIACWYDGTVFCFVDGTSG